MSKNIVIQETGVSKTMNSIKKVITQKQGGGNVEWVPEDDMERGAKTVTQNGTYYAKNDNLYAYADVIVKTKAKVVGKKKPKTGEMQDVNEYELDVNPEGYITETKVVSSIRITTQPSKTNYTNGESISISGIVVTGYYGDGTSAGTIPNSELSIDPTIASGSSQTITVRWNRTEDGKELTDTFSITIIG